VSKLAVIVNAGAGQGHDQALVQTLHDQFDAHGLRPDVVLAHSGEEMISAAHSALARGVDTIVAGGGDGTINAVASVVAGSNAVFGVLPMGTLNHFAKDLKIPLELDGAIAVIAQGKARRVDVGEVNERIFINNSSLGLYPDIVRDRERQQSRLGRGKWLAFCWATVAALRRYPFLSVRVQMGEDSHARRTPFVFIGNNEYTMQGFNIGERDRIDAGHLSLYVAQRPTRLGLVRMAFSALFGRLKQARDFDVLHSGELLVETRHKRLRVATDGEVTVMNTPLRYRIRPGALMVLAP
jgi:diacylglycerol kinase family enzyme